MADSSSQTPPEQSSVLEQSEHLFQSEPPPIEGQERPTRGFYRINELEQRMTDDLRWAQTAAEVRVHRGQHVAIYQKQVLATGTDFNAVRNEAAAIAGCPPEHIVIKTVPPGDFRSFSV